MMTVYKADPNHSSAHFNLKNLVIPDLTGDFTSLSGKFKYDPEQVDQSFIEACINVKSIVTGNQVRDEELRGESFFNTRKYPNIIFTSKSFHALDEDVLQVHGELTVKDVTREVVLNVERPSKDTKTTMNLVASTIVERAQFKLELGPILEAGEMLLGDHIQITMDIALIRE